MIFTILTLNSGELLPHLLPALWVGDSLQLCRFVFNFPPHLGLLLVAEDTQREIFERVSKCLKGGRALISVAQWVGHHPTKQKVASSILSLSFSSSCLNK